MAIVVKIGGTVAKIKDGVWECSDPLLLRILKSYRAGLIERYTAWTDYTTAELAIENLGGKITKESSPPAFSERMIY